MSTIIILITICLLSLAAAYKFIPTNKYKKIYISLAFLALLIRIAIVFYLYWNRTATFGTDGLLYHHDGIRVARQLAEGVPFYSVDYSYTWYTAFVGLIYHIFGVNRYIVSFINTAFAFFSAILLFKMALTQKYSFINAAFISLIFLYFPNLCLWTADSRKEALLIFICFLCLYSVQHFVKLIMSSKSNIAESIAHIVFICFLIWLGTLMRIYMFIPLAFCIMFSQFILFKKSRNRMSLVLMAAASISCIFIFFSTVYPQLSNYHAVMFPDQTGNVGKDISNSLETVKLLASSRNILFSVVSYMMLPYPGIINIADIGGSLTLKSIVSMDMVVWYVCLLFMLTGIYTAIKKKDCFLFGGLAFIASYVFINVLVVENVADTIYRYRSVIVGISLLFIDLNVVLGVLKYFFSALRFKDLNTKAGSISGISIKSNL